MKRNFVFLLACFVTLAVGTSCKKYPEGGSGLNLKKKIDGGFNYEFEKQWKLAKYKVNDVDSTSEFSTISNINQSKEVTIESVKRSDREFEIRTKMARYNMQITKDRLYMVITPGTGLVPEAGWNCSGPCERIIFMPMAGASCYWKIAKMTKEELVLTLNKTNSYRIELTHYE